jgi:hypothetical protein
MVAYCAAVLARGGGSAAGAITGVIGTIIVVFALIARALGFGKPDPNKWYGKDELPALWLLLGVQTHHGPRSVPALLCQ